MDPIHVLLVEDEQTLAMIIKDTLEGQGFRIRLAKDGEEGLQCFFHEKGCNASSTKSPTCWWPT